MGECLTSENVGRISMQRKEKIGERIEKRPKGLQRHLILGVRDTKLDMIDFLTDLRNFHIQYQAGNHNRRGH